MDSMVLQGSQRLWQGEWGKTQPPICSPALWERPRLQVTIQQGQRPMAAWMYLGW